MQVEGVALVFGAGTYVLLFDDHGSKLNQITGSGIGRAVAHTLVAQGLTTLVCADIDLAHAQETAESSYEVFAERRPAYEATAYQVDVRDEAQVQEVVAKTKDRYGRIDICVTTAGVSRTPHICCSMCEIMIDY